MRIPRLLCMLLACAACRGRHPAQPAVATPAVRTEPVRLDPQVPLRVEDIGTPIRSVRTWTSALAPNPRGGWNFITQAYELDSTSPTEFVVVDLAQGTYSISEGTSKDYAVSKFQVKNELRARNGRIFFPLAGAALAYYDPATESVEELPPLLDPSGPDKIIYDAKFGPDGMLYGGTQSNGLPTIVQIDPNTLKTRVIGHVGRDRNQYSYAYQIAVDPPWVYATVGESPWELAAINIDTGESKVLATRTDRPWMKLEVSAEGVQASLITGLRTSQPKTDRAWCVAGKLVPADAPGAAPPRLRRARPLLITNGEPLANAPEIDDSELTPDSTGTGHVRWRMPGEHDWKTAEFRVKYQTPIKLETLAALPDGTLFGGARQYHGFFRYDPRASRMTVYGPPGPSQSRVAVVDNIVYTVGYPNGVLYAFDLAHPWTAKTPADADVPSANPHKLGNFSGSATKYGYALVPWDGRLYYAGRRERDGVGSGVGYYELSSHQFAGHDQNLELLNPQNIAVLPSLSAVVFSGRLRDPSTPGDGAPLIIYDRELTERARVFVKPGLTDTGMIFPTRAPNVIIGFIAEANAAYLYDVAARKLVAWKDLAGAPILAVAQRPDDDSLWTVIDGSLVRIDPQTLEPVVFGAPGSVPAGIEHLAWQGPDLFMTVDSELYRAARVGLP